MSKIYGHVYLAGPITGLSYEGCEGWKPEARKLIDQHIALYSPLRGKDYLRPLKVVEDQHESLDILSGQRGITYRDFHDVSRADLLLVNMLGAKRVSIGTCIEIAWAFSMKKPVICVMEAEGNPNDHSMLRECCSLIVQDMAKACELVNKFLLPDTILDARGSQQKSAEAVLAAQGQIKNIQSLTKEQFSEELQKQMSRAARVAGPDKCCRSEQPPAPEAKKTVELSTDEFIEMFMRPTSSFDTGVSYIVKNPRIEALMEAAVECAAKLNDKPAH
jgi:nucleoside 2-deoxyribosyltransferase